MERMLMLVGNLSALAGILLCAGAGACLLYTSDAADEYQRV